MSRDLPPRLPKENRSRIEGFIEFLESVFNPRRSGFQPDKACRVGRLPARQSLPRRPASSPTKPATGRMPVLREFLLDFI